jgi:hypothetical protein
VFDQNVRCILFGTFPAEFGTLPCQLILLFDFPFGERFHCCVVVSKPGITCNIGKGTKVIEAHYLATGRLSSLRSTVRTAFRFLLLQLSVPALAGRAWEAMHALAELEADHGE